jgi:hypothetical protein
VRLYRERLGAGKARPLSGGDAQQFRRLHSNSHEGNHKAKPRFADHASPKREPQWIEIRESRRVNRDSEQ